MEENGNCILAEKVIVTNAAAAVEIINKSSPDNNDQQSFTFSNTVPGKMG
jgi:hypothetical protein